MIVTIECVDCPEPTHQNLVAIGRVDTPEGPRMTLALSGDRTAFAFGPGNAFSEIERGLIGPAIYRSLDETAYRLWGAAWPSSLGTIFGINRRTVQRDRVSKFLLPPQILQFVGIIASSEQSKPLASAILAFANYRDALGDQQSATLAWGAVPDVIGRFLDPTKRYKRPTG